MYDKYIVQEGDTLDKVASFLNINPEVIKILNNDSLSFVPGSILIIPKRTSKYFDYYTISKGDTLYKIATENNIDPNLLAMLNGIEMDDYIYPNQTLLVPKAGSSLYITAEGDTLSEVAKGFNVSMDELIRQNPQIYLQKEQLIVYKYE